MNKGERVAEKGVKIFERNIDSTNSSFTDESFNKDESENLNIRKVSTNKETLKSSKGKSKVNEFSNKEGGTGIREEINNLLDEFDSETNGKSVSSNESSCIEQQEDANENDITIEEETDSNIGQDERPKRRTKTTKIKDNHL